MPNKFLFSWCDPHRDVLIGLQSCAVGVENMETGDIKEAHMLSIGLLICRIDLIF